MTSTDTHRPFRSPRYRLAFYRTEKTSQFSNVSKSNRPDELQNLEAPNEVPTHGTYKELLFTKEWQEKRLQILERDSFQCAICNSKDNLQVHHRQYHFSKEKSEFKPPWDYPNSSLVTLCETCHKKGHSKYNVPILYIP
jgi:5-methylcytosine-specific restriction endonuclease McrA